MKIQRWLVVCLLCQSAPWLGAQDERLAAISPDDPVGYEISLVRIARTRMSQDDLTGVSALLADPGAAAERSAGDGVLLARRAAMICGWLQNDNDYARAIRVGNLAQRLLSSFQGVATADDVERAYWQAVILGRTLGRYDEAIALLEAARQVAPDQNRLLELEYEYLRMAPPATENNEVGVDQ